MQVHLLSALLDPPVGAEQGNDRRPSTTRPSGKAAGEPTARPGGKAAGELGSITEAVGWDVRWDALVDGDLGDLKMWWEVDDDYDW